MLQQVFPRSREEEACEKSANGFVVRAKPWAAATMNSEKLPCLGVCQYFVCESVLCV